MSTVLTIVNPKKTATLAVELNFAGMEKFIRAHQNDGLGVETALIDVQIAVDTAMEKLRRKAKRYAAAQEARQHKED